MKLLTHAQFVEMPRGTIFAVAQDRWAFSGLAIKGTTCANNKDWMLVDSFYEVDGRSDFEVFDILDAAENTGAAVPLDLQTQSRDGLYDDTRWFLVYEPQDVEALIARLQQALAGKDDYE